MKIHTRAQKHKLHIIWIFLKYQIFGKISLVNTTSLTLFAKHRIESKICSTYNYYINVVKVFTLYQS